ncbi:SRPBCC domain-containing protein [Luteimonas sp. SX5]|uniref:SRPBCC domain-containing protein n=1 Tax=Luteimonas galliterrae TaxID=2940486 RepID=A0ABT0MIT9_9GAMM|nr:SRPBCC domain-containing protein [Luteimonas galliterrae]MCL1634791.1 SRPBCC domain-containing protein [Luteimonas galliterrae]
MVDILHRVGIQSSSGAVYRAIATSEGVAGWWTVDAEGDGGAGGTLRFRFGELGFCDMKVLEADPGKRVLWQVTDGPREWIGTTVAWDLEQEDGDTVVLFKHQGWKEPVEFMHHCSTKWAVFLLSLKSLLETGKGSPYPDDVKIDNWN